MVYLHKGWPASIATLARTQSLGGQSLTMTIIEFVSVIPFLVVPAIVLLSLFELRHRAIFEKEMTRAIGEEDMRHLQGYYGLSPSHKIDGDAPAQRSGFWVMEYDNRIIGAVGLDGRNPGAQLDSMVDIAVDNSIKGQDETPNKPGTHSATSTATALSSDLRSRNTSRLNTSLPTPRVSITPPTPSSATFASADTVHLRRFAASRSFRPAGIEADLLSHAATAAFAPSLSPSGKGSAAPAQNIVVAARPSVQWELVGELLKAGYELVPKGGELELEVERAGQAGGPVEELVRLIWPLDLGWRTYVLKRSTWEAKKAVEDK